MSHRLSEQQVSLGRFPDRLVEPFDLRSLLEAQPVVLPTAETGVRIGFDALTDRLGVRPQIAAEVDDMAMMRLLAHDGVGLAVLPPIVVQDELSSGRLIEADRLPGISETFFAVTLKRRLPNPLVVELLERPKQSSAAFASAKPKSTGRGSVEGPRPETARPCRRGPVRSAGVLSP